MRIHEMIEGIHSRDDLVAFVEALLQDLKSRPEDWENGTLERYLSALASWLSDSDGYYRSRGISVPVNPTWKMVAEMMIAAKMYE